MFTVFDVCECFNISSLCVFVSPASLLKGLKHSNIVLLHDIIHTKETLTLVFEYVVSIKCLPPVQNFRMFMYSSV